MVASCVPMLLVHAHANQIHSIQFHACIDWNNKRTVLTMQITVNLFHSPGLCCSGPVCPVEPVLNQLAGQPGMHRISQSNTAAKSPTCVEAGLFFPMLAISVFSSSVSNAGSNREHSSIASGEHSPTLNGVALSENKNCTLNGSLKIKTDQQT